MSMLVDFKTLKPFTKKLYGDKVIGRVFPQYIKGVFSNFLVIPTKGPWYRIINDGTKSFNFTINVGLCIEKDDYYKLGSYIIEYFEDFFYIDNNIRHYVILDNEEKKKFVQLCQSFQSKKWDDIIEEFCEGLNTLSFSGKVNNIPLYGAE